jgi:hypothetical protein
MNARQLDKRLAPLEAIGTVPKPSEGALAKAWFLERFGLTLDEISVDQLMRIEQMLKEWPRAVPVPDAAISACLR